MVKKTIARSLQLLRDPIIRQVVGNTKREVQLERCLNVSNVLMGMVIYSWKAPLFSHWKYLWLYEYRHIGLRGKLAPGTQPVMSHQVTVSQQNTVLPKLTYFLSLIWIRVIETALLLFNPICNVVPKVMGLNSHAVFIAHVQIKSCPKSLMVRIGQIYHETFNMIYILIFKP